jgi:hypothetical membrane protein
MRKDRVTRSATRSEVRAATGGGSVRGVRGGVLGGVVGPVAFVAAWLGAGLATGGYSAVEGAISDLAAVGAPHRGLMTLGFVVFGVAVPIYGLALRRVLPGWSWLAAVVCGVATLGVAAVPLGRGTDGLHGAFAGLGYVALTLVPALAAPQFRRAGHLRWWVGSCTLAVIAGLSLLATTVGPAHGAFQRLGLTAGDAFLVASAVAVLRSAGVVEGSDDGHLVWLRPLTRRP